mgnify:CR=1 FL=1|tara:strand:- start:186 stop:644 length:459 start_codon:yes stop_codon:yes gene_type:complete
MNNVITYEYLINDCLSKNITLNSQLSYWKGQKRWINAPTGEEYPAYRGFTLNNYNPFSCLAEWKYKTRNGLGMKWENRVRTIWGWGLYTYRLNSPPIIFLWNYICKECRTIKFLNKICVLQRKFKYYIKSSKGIREWTTLIKIKSGFGCVKF